MKIFSYSKPSFLFSAVIFVFFAFGAAIFFRPFSEIQVSRSASAMSTPPDSVIQQNKNSVDSIYRSILLAADKLLAGKNYEKCMLELEKAQKMRPNDPVLKDRIVKTRLLVIEQKNQNTDYLKALASGDKYFESKDYLNAKASYQLAVGQNPDDSIAKSKLRKTMDLLRSTKAQNILYDVAVASADKLFQSHEYEKARLEYENASKILPSEQYPKTKVNEIVKIQVDKQVNEAEYTKAIAEADKFYGSKAFQSALKDYKRANNLKPDQKYPQDRIAELTALINAQMAKDEAYNKSIALADQLYTETRYIDSKKAYQQALTIKPAEEYPKTKIKEIDGLLAQARKVQEEYDKYISFADSFYIDKSYSRARENYLLASTVKPKENYPREMLSKVEKMMTGQEAALIKSLNEQYTTAIASADKLLTEKSFKPARDEYVKASNLKPLEDYPKVKIAEVDKILELSLKEKVLEDNYNAVISKADKLFTDKSYGLARTEYTNASGLKPAEGYPKERITVIDNLLAGIATQKALDEKYQAIVMNADKLLLAKTYDQARAEYVKAGEIKPEEQYPKTKLTEIDKIVADLAALKSLDENYRAAIALADQGMTDKNYEKAKQSYQEAGKLKPAEQYPKTKIAEIDRILQSMAAEKAQGEQYATVIRKGDSLLALKVYEPAQSAYQDAQKLKPAETYPREKIAEISGILGEMSRLAKLDTQYQTVISKADKLFTDKSYGLA
ncbi:MAG: hypothetical protein WCI71_16305, partial [Bacteroidota bacterium]